MSVIFAPTWGVVHGSFGAQRARLHAAGAVANIPTRGRAEESSSSFYLYWRSLGGCRCERACRSKLAMPVGRILVPGQLIFYCENTRRARGYIPCALRVFS